MLGKALLLNALKGSKPGTIPLGVLKRDHPILFDPALPESKLRSISRLGVGTMEKVALRFQDIWMAWSMVVPKYVSPGLRIHQF